MQAASAAGVPILMIELGNEFFNNHDDYEAACVRPNEYIGDHHRAIGDSQPHDRRFESCFHPKAVHFNPYFNARLGDSFRLLNASLSAI
jgi:hypothetical protein